MTRGTVLAVAVIFGLAGASLPVIAALWVSGELAIEDRQYQLREIASRGARRADETLAGAARALEAANALDVAPCSDRHIDALRRLTINNRFIDEIGCFRADRLQCTTWGVAGASIVRPPTRQSLAGLDLATDVYPQVMGGSPRMALFAGAHDVLINPERLVDAILRPGISLAVGTADGHLLATRNTPDLPLVRALMSHPRAGADDRFLYYGLRSSRWTVVVMEPLNGLKSVRDGKCALVLPAAVLAAMAIVLAVVFLARRRLSPAGELKAAIRHREFIVLYQPVVELATGRSIGAEALVRWRKADGTLLSPCAFIPLAEQEGLSDAITRQLLDAIVEDLRDLLETDPDCHIAINLAAAEIMDGTIFPLLEERLSRTAIRTDQIWLEVTEGGFVEIETGRAFIELARLHGYRIAIDDFGTGYSCLQYLQDFPVDALKIDKSFVAVLGRETAKSPVAPLIIAMAKLLSVDCIAEGVETEAQHEMLRDMGVMLGQGWLFSPPLTVADFIAYHCAYRAGGAGPVDGCAGAG